MNKTIITLISGITVVVGALGTVGVATVAPAQALTDPATVEQMCDDIPEAKEDLAQQVEGLTTSLATATSTLATRRATMTSTIGVFGGSVVNFLKAFDANANTTAAFNILKGHQANFVDSVVEWSHARTVLADNDKALTFAQLQSSFLQSAEASGCTAT